MVESRPSEETASGLDMFGWVGPPADCKGQKLVGLLRSPLCQTHQALIVALDPPLWPLLQLLEFCCLLRPSGLGRSHTALCQIWPPKQLLNGTEDETQKWGTVYSLWGQFWWMRTSRQRNQTEIPPVSLSMHCWKARPLLTAGPEESSMWTHLPSPLWAPFGSSWNRTSS